MPVGAHPTTHAGTLEVVVDPHRGDDAAAQSGKPVAFQTIGAVSTCGDYTKARAHAETHTTHPHQHIALALLPLHP